MLIIALCLLGLALEASAFRSVIPTRPADRSALQILFSQNSSRRTRLSQSTSQLSMCICIDCARVTNCAAYHFVETKHEQPHMTENPTFSPREGSPTIHVNVRTQRDEAEMARMWREHESETSKARATGGEEGTLHGETVYDLSPVTTIEYDVVACEDFVEDKGCWVRNMPAEIRKANPDFVPT